MRSQTFLSFLLAYQRSGALVIEYSRIVLGSAGVVGWIQPVEFALTEVPENRASCSQYVSIDRECIVATYAIECILA